MTRIKWLDRTIMYGPFLTLCTSQDEFDAVMKRLGEKDAGDWMPPQAEACVHTLDRPQGGICCVVCIPADVDPLNAALHLAHEAVHVAERQWEHLGETNPSEELRAFAVQNILASLLEEFVNRK